MALLGQSLLLTKPLASLVYGMALLGQSILLTKLMASLVYGMAVLGQSLQSPDKTNG